MSHVNIGKAHPAAYKAMMEFNNQVMDIAEESGLDHKLTELVKIRASQLKGGAFCLKIHTQDAIQLGETTDRLAVLPAWWESQYFTRREQAALQLTEQVTLISDHGKIPSRGISPVDHLDETQIAAVTWVAVVINSWNRIAISSHYPVGPAK